MPDSFRITGTHPPAPDAPDAPDQASEDAWFERVFGSASASASVSETSDGLAGLLTAAISPSRHRLRGGARYAFGLDHRNAAGWAPGDAQGPLGVERCAFHTLLTDNPRRALRTLVDALGGTVFYQGRDEVIGADASYVRLADTVLQLAVPDEGTAAYADWTTTAPDDTYYSLTFKVADLGRAAAHLKSQGVGIRSQAGDTLVTDPDTSIGVPWGFTTLLVPGDPRV
jgi:hypothetical protein